MDNLALQIGGLLMLASKVFKIPLMLRKFNALSKMQNGLHCNLTALILLFTCNLFFLFSKPNEIGNLFFHSLTTQDGLSTNYYASFFHRDSYGFMWIGSIEGLNCFDGQKVSIYRYDSQNKHSLCDNNIQSSFFEDSDQNLWFSTYTGINCYVRTENNFRRYYLKNQNGDTIKTDYRVVYLEANKNLWVRAGSSLYSFDIQSKKQVKIIHDFIGIRNTVETDAAEKVKRVFAANWLKGYGFDVYEYKSNILVKSKHLASTSETINQILIENDSIIWLSAGNNGLLLYNIREKKIISRFTRFNEIEVVCNDIQELDSNTLLVASNTSGIFLFDRKKKQFIKQFSYRSLQKNSIPFNNVYSAHIDNYKYLWASSINGGICYTYINQTTFDQQSNELDALKLVHEPKGNISVITTNQGIWSFNTTSKIVKKWNLAPAVTDKVQQIYFDQDSIWVLNRIGLFLLKGKRLIYHLKAPEKAIYPREMIETKDQRKIVTFNFGVYELIDNQLHAIKYFNNNFSSHCIFKDKKERIYLNNNSDWVGIYSFSGKIKLIKKLEISARLYCFYEDVASNQIYLGTSKGLYILDGKTLELTQKKYLNYLNGFSIYSIAKNRDNSLWLATNDGLYLWKNKLIRFSEYDGLLSNDCRSVLVQKNGHLTIATPKGLNMLDASALTNLKNNTKHKLTELKVNYKSTSYFNQDLLKLSYWQNNLSFNFTSFSYGYAPKFKYKLTQHDNAWISSNDGFAHYSRLRPGKYSFFVKSSNNNNIWAPAQRMIKLVITPPFWQTWWFILFCVLFIAGSTYTLYHYRIRQLKKEFLFQQKAVASEMKALRAQMNPHFIFNSLNSINAFIVTNKSAQAAQQLTQFSNLMRQILDHSSKDVISLEQEIEFLETYLQIEAVRMDNKLSYTIQVAPEIDTFETEIPSMVLQPYLENAIWHGLSMRKEGGKINLWISKQNDTLLLCIEDNGIGRAKAATLRKGQHHSKGMQITAERLALHAEKYHKQVAVQIIDLMDADEALGTRVEIQIGPKN